MDAQRFDAIIRVVTSARSRRDVVHLLTTAVAAGVGVAHVHEAAA
jgi:type 1 glutamine amidotransferase